MVDLEQASEHFRDKAAMSEHSQLRDELEYAKRPGGKPFTPQQEVTIRQRMDELAGKSGPVSYKQGLKSHDNTGVILTDRYRKALQAQDTQNKAQAEETINNMNSRVVNQTSPSVGRVPTAPISPQRTGLIGRLIGGVQRVLNTGKGK